MLSAIALLLTSQLVGELIARGLDWPVPGPVLGLALMLCILTLRPSILGTVRPTSSVILANLSLLFLPAGVGVLANFDILLRYWAAIAGVLVLSTMLSMMASVGTFLLVRNLMGRRPE